MQIHVKVRLIAAAALAACCLCGGHARAGIISTSGQVDVLSTPPASLLNGHLQSNTTIFAFTERTDLTLSSALPVDVSTQGTYQKLSSLTPGTIAAGTMVDSYFLHSDPPNGNSTYNASLTFSSPILGIIVLSSSLSSTDSILGAPGTVYPSKDGTRGLEFGKTEDYVVWVSGDTVDVQFHTHSSIDEIRIITAASPVPEPTGLVLGASALGVLGLARVYQVRRRRVR